MGRLPLFQLPQRGRWGGWAQGEVGSQLGQHRTGVGHEWAGCIVVEGAVARYGGVVCRRAVYGGCVVWGWGLLVMSEEGLEGFVQR